MARVTSYTVQMRQNLTPHESCSSTQVTSSSTGQKLPQYPVKGSVEVPGASDSVGSVEIRTLPPPKPVPPPTIVRYGDVQITPKGCATCPVLDTTAVELQKEKMRENQARIERLDTLLEANREKMRKAVENMKFIKDVMHSSVFDMKEAIKKIDVDIESKMMAAEKKIGPPGLRVSATLFSSV